MATNENLQAAFAGESQANRKYLAFAEQAETDGLAQVAKLFRAAAEAETVHAHAHFRVMDGVKTTAENLEAAIEGEGYECKSMYPEFLEAAKAEGEAKAVTSFERALAVEKVHYGLYSTALEAVKGGRDLPEKKIYVCSVCGNTVEGEVPDICPVCNVKSDRFVEVT